MFDGSIRKLIHKLNPSRFPKTRCRDIRLAVTGASRAGKTVFLTSLINHIKCHHPDKFWLSPRGSRLVRPDDTPPEGAVWETFNYEAYRQCLAAKEGKWPDKTKDQSTYTLSFHQKDAFFTRYRLTLYDIPGERFADAGMAYMDYSRWSKAQVDILEATLGQDTPDGEDSNKPRLEPVRRYLELVRKAEGGLEREADVILQYKRALVALGEHLHNQLSPSVFALDKQGETWRQTYTTLTRECSGESIARQRDQVIERLIRERKAGLPFGEFCPLTQSWNRELVKMFEQRYEQYKQEIVLPLFRTLAGCDGMVVLFDLAKILSSGPRHLNEARSFMAQIVKALQPGGDLVQWLLSAFGVRRRIQRIAVAASQCDRFCERDWGTLATLVRHLSERYIEDCPGIRTDYFYLSSVKTTEQDRNSGILRGITAPGGRVGDYVVSRFPADSCWGEGWPSDWDPAAFRRLPRFYPRFPPVFDAPPEHVNLDRLFGFVTGWFPRAGLQPDRKAL